MALSGLVAVVTAVLLAPGAAVAAPSDGTRTVFGTVESVIVDPLPGAPAGAERTLTYVRAEGRLLAVPAGSLTGAAPGRRARLELTSRGPSATVVSAELNGAATRTRAAAAAGSHRLTLLPVFWTAKDAETQSSLTTLANQAKSYWAEQSNGAVAIDVEVRDWKQTAAPAGSCDATAIFNAAIAAHGVAAPTDARNHVAVYFPRQSACAWAGLGSVNGPIIWINGYPLEDVLTHEFGHNLGLGHANKATCTANGTRVALSSTCTIAQYEDVTDVMGYARAGFGSGNLNSAFGDYLGLQQTTTTSPAQLTALSAHSGTSGLKLTVPAGTVFVDYRPAAGRDIRAPGWAGVQVRLRTATNPPTTQLLDMQPGSATPFSAAHLPVGGVWPIPGTNQSVKVTSAGGGTATVQITAAADTTAPKVAPVVTGATTPVRTASTPVTWTAAADAESGIAAYRVSVNGNTVTETDGGALTADVPLTEGANAIVVTAVNGSGLVKNSTAKKVVRDSTAPAPVTGPKVAATGRSVSWTAPADTGTTRSYAVRVDGQLVKTVAASPAAVSIAAGRRTVSVTPSDAAGNTGPATETTLWIDPTAPAAAVVTAPQPDIWQNSRQFGVTWTAASAPGSGIDSYTVKAGGRSTTVGGDTTSTVVTVPVDGTSTVTVTAKNMAGVVSRAATVTARVDTVAPAAPTAVKLAADQSRITWTAPGNSGSPVSWRVQLDGGDPVVVTRPEALNSATPGLHTWTVTPVDAAGNVGAAGTVTAWTDRTAPTAPVITAPAADGFARTAPVTVTWNEAADDESGIAGYVVTAGTQKSTVTGTSYSYRPIDGRQTVTVTAVNRAGVRSAPVPVTFTYDRTAPTGVTKAKITGTGDTTMLTWTAATDRTSGLAEYVLSLNGVRVTTVPATATTATVTTPAGRHVWTITAVDNAGNSGPAVTAS